MTTIIFAIPPQRFLTHKPAVTPKGGMHDAYMLFCDAAPRGEGSKLSMGIYLPHKEWRRWLCPRWVTSLQQAELMAAVRAFRLAAYMRWPGAYLGSESFVARAQLTNLRASTSLPVQQRIL